MREITAIQLVKDLSILDTMDQLLTYYARFCLDNYLVEEVQEAIKNVMIFIQRIILHMNLFTVDLVMI